MVGDIIIDSWERAKNKKGDYSGNPTNNQNSPKQNIFFLGHDQGVLFSAFISKIDTKHIF